CQGSSPDCGSNVGACVDLWAPASHIVSASKQGTNLYCRLSGTSMAAPHLSGAIALYLQAHPAASIPELVNALRAGGTWGALRATPADPHWIGPGSDNLLLFSRVTATSEIVPVASFTYRCTGRTCSFDGSGSTGAHPLQYSWDFGDGTTASGATA